MKVFKAPSRAAATLVICMVALVATTICAQQFTNTKAEDKTTTQLVCQLMSRYHIKQGKIDDDVSKRLLERYLKDLDPQKLYLTKVQVDQLRQSQTQLDDQLRDGNVDFSYTMFDLYKVAVSQRIELAHKLIDQPHDFTVNEEIDTDPDAIDWAASDAELADRWRKRIKADLLTFKLDDEKDEEARDRLHKRYRMIKTTIDQTEKHEILEMYLSAMAHCFDPHSSYMSPQTVEDFNIQMRLSLDGIGAALRSEDGYTVVAQIVPGGAAEADGNLKVGDKVIAVGQETGEMVDIVEMKLSKVVRLIRGERGSKVRLQVKTEADDKVVTYTLTRQKIELKSDEVKGEILKTSDAVTGKPVRVGVINIPSFYRDFEGAQQGVQDFKSTARDVRVVLEDFKKQGGVEAVVIDLRMNGGGALSEAIEVSGLFIDQGPVVQVKELDGSVKHHDDTAGGVAWDGPLVVICNRLSASASEIFAGVIKDYRRGVVVGDTTTHGKGTVQNVMPVRIFFSTKDRGALKLTINQFYRVNGESTQHKGVTSDVVLPSLIDHMDLGESSLDNALAFDQIKPAEFTPVQSKANHDQLVNYLAAASKQRVANNKEFQEALQDIAKYEERKKSKKLSLNYEVRKQELTELERERKEEEKQEAEGTKTDGPIFPQGYYNDEIIQITSDYVRVMTNKTTANNN